jgi:hypothetical protein
MARPQIFERDLRLATASLDPVVISRDLARFARQAIADLQGSGEAPASYRRYVNGRPDLPEEQVVAPGPIIYDLSWLPEIEVYCLSFGDSSRSPRRSGRYRRSFFSLVDGQLRHQPGTPIDPESELVIVNDAPYARRIEVGRKKDGRPFVVQVPPEIFLDMRQALLARFGNIVTASRRFVGLSGGSGTFPALVISQRSS